MADPGAPESPAFGGELVVRAPGGSGGLAVATDGLQLAAERCRAIAEAARRGVAGTRLAIELGRRADDGSIAARRCADGLAAAEQQLLRLAKGGAELAHDIAAAAVAYDAVEEAVGRVQRQLAATAGAAAGVALRNLAVGGLATLLFLVVANPGLVATVVALGLAGAGAGRGGARGVAGGLSGPDHDGPGRRGPTPADAEGLGDWLVSHPELITSPEFVDLVRLVAASSDDAALAALGLPAPLARLLGEDALGVTGVAFGTAVVIGLGGVAGALRETPVAVERRAVREGPAAPEGAPAGSAERLARIPEGDNQIRIERYTAPGEAPRWAVYVSPTVTFDVAGGEPFDMRSNLHGVAGGSPAALRAVEAAMRDAGVAAGDEVQLVGFSQGGMIAARVAESGRWNAVGLETYGAPVGNVELPEGLHGVTVRHSDDLVPALAGPDRSDVLLRVERRAFLPGEEIPHVAAPAHQKASYAETARLLDGARSGVLREELARLDGFGQDFLDREGGSLAVFDYRAERVSPAASP